MSENETYTTERGYTITFKGISGLLDKVRLAHKDPEQPMYEVKTAAGLVEYHPLDEKSAETPEEKARLAEYQIKVAETDFARYLAMCQCVLLHSVVVEMPQDDSWIKVQEAIKIKVPTDPIERRLHWLETELYGSQQDFENIFLGAMRASGTDEEILSQMADSFRHPLGKSEGSETKSTRNSKHK